MYFLLAMHVGSIYVVSPLGLVNKAQSSAFRLSFVAASPKNASLALQDEGYLIARLRNRLGLSESRLLSHYYRCGIGSTEVSNGSMSRQCQVVPVHSSLGPSMGAFLVFRWGVSALAGESWRSGLLCRLPWTFEKGKAQCFSDKEF